MKTNFKNFITAFLIANALYLAYQVCYIWFSGYWSQDFAWTAFRSNAYLGLFPSVQAGTAWALWKNYASNEDEHFLPAATSLLCSALICIVVLEGMFMQILAFAKINHAVDIIKHTLDRILTN